MSKKKKKNKQNKNKNGFNNTRTKTNSKISKVSESRKKNTIFCILKLFTQFVGVLAILISDTHSKYLFLSSLVFMIPILSDYITLMLTSDKNHIQFIITSLVLIVYFLMTIAFLMGAMNLITIDLNKNILALNAINGNCLFSTRYFLKEKPIYIFMIISSGLYLLEFTGVLKRDIVVPEKVRLVEEGTI